MDGALFEAMFDMAVGVMRQNGAKRGWAAERRGFECSGCGGGATRVRMQWMWQ